MKISQMCLSAATETPLYPLCCLPSSFYSLALKVTESTLPFPQAIFIPVKDYTISISFTTKIKCVLFWHILSLLHFYTLRWCSRVPACRSLVRSSDLARKPICLFFACPLVSSLMYCMHSPKAHMLG